MAIKEENAIIFRPKGLRTLIDPAVLEMLLDGFSARTGLPICLYEREECDFPAVARKKFTKFCEEIRDCEEGLRRCEEDHRRRAEKVFKMKMEICHAGMEICHAGLFNFAAPIKVGNQIRGTLLTGQRRLKEREEESLKSIEKVAKELALNEGRLKELYYESVPLIEEEEIKRLLEDLANIVGYISKIATEKLEFKEHVLKLTHELTIPMQAIIAHAENLARGRITEEEKVDTSKTICDEMLKLSMLVKGLRHMALRERGERYIFKLKNIYPILRDAKDLFEREAKRKGVNIWVESRGTQFPRLLIDPFRFELAVYNLLHNAVKYSYPNTTIEIIGYQKDMYFVVDFSNYGLRIREDELPRIFDSGFRTEEAKRLSSTGSGIGTTLVREIIEKHSGMVKVESVPLSKGNKTTFSVYIPYRGDKNG